jgi:hypothetical protein
MRGATFVVAATLLAACGRPPVRTTTSAPAPSAAPLTDGTIAVLVERTGREAAAGRDLAEVEALRTLLFRGVPGSRQPRPLVPAGVDTTAHRALLTRLLRDGGHRDYVVRTDGPVRTADGARFTVTYNLDLLRRALEQGNLVPRLGIP